MEQVILQLYQDECLSCCLFFGRIDASIAIMCEPDQATYTLSAWHAQGHKLAKHKKQRAHQNSAFVV